ncbi:hypothetical protein GCM10010412_001310 [Nonomuraea recticatena]|uniref:Uncharacterized protein n=1 Tax=Nonomuraea recticatena TaxID=46178 RepID=A0ABN3R3G0_9ACTN
MEATDEVFVSYHQMLVAEPGAYPPEGLTGGLAASAPGAAVIRTGIHTGNVDVTVRLTTAAPDAQDGWEEEAEVDLITSTGEMWLAGLMNGPADLPNLTPHGPGRYRMRVHARGRGINYDGVATKPCEFYLLVVWPVELVPEVVASRLPEPLPRSQSDEIRDWARRYGHVYSERGRPASGPGFPGGGPVR